MLYIPRMLIASLGWAGSELLVDPPGRLLSRAALARPASRSSGTETPPEAGTAAPDMGRSAPWMYHQDPASGVKLEAGGDARRSPTTATRNAAGAASKSCSVVGAASKSHLRSPPPLRRSGRLHPPALDAPGPPCCFPSWLPRLLCLLAAVVVDSWPCGRSGAQTGGCGRVASCAVGRSRLAELRWPSASAAEGLSMLLLHAARVGC